ncbi:Ig-like domain-containing protein [Bacteroidota bacterium]
MKRITHIIPLLLLPFLACREGKLVEPSYSEEPIVKIISPRNNSAVFHRTDILIEANDNRSIVSINVYVDGIQLQKEAVYLGKNIFKYTWNTPQQEDSSYHNIHAEVMDDDDNSAQSNSIRVIVYKFKPPDSLSFTQLSDNEIILEWKDKSVKEHGFSLERSGRTGEYIEIAKVQANDTYYIDNSLITDGDYTYRLRGYRDSIFSDYSNTLSVTYSQNLEFFNYLDGHEDKVLTCDFTFNGNILATGSADETIRLWNTSDGSLIRTINTSGSYVHTLKFTPDGSKIISGGSDGKIKVWSKNNGTLINTISGEGNNCHTGEINALDIRKDGNKLISACNDRLIKVWDLNSFQLDFTIDFFNQPQYRLWPVRDVEYSPNGEYIALARESEMYIVIPSGDSNIMWPPVNHQFPVPTGDLLLCLDYRFDGNFILSGYDNGRLYIWDTRVTTIQENYINTEFSNKLFAAVFSPNGEWILCGGSNGKIYLVNFFDKKIVQTIYPDKGSIYSLNYSPDGEKAVSCHENEAVLWKVKYNWKSL